MNINTKTTKLKDLTQLFMQDGIQKITGDKLYFK